MDEVQARAFAAAATQATDEEDATALLPFLDSEDAMVLTTAAMLAVVVDSEKAAPLIREMMSTTEPVRDLLAIALGFDPSTENVEFLITQLDDKGKENAGAVMIAFSIITGISHEKPKEWVQWWSELPRRISTRPR